MKPTCFILAFLALMMIPFTLNAALCDYNCVIYPNQPYTEITGGTVIGNESTDDQRFTDPALTLGTNGTSNLGPGFPMGFSFNFNGATFDRVAINANGWISLGQSSLGTSAVNIGSTVTYQPLSSSMTITPSQLTSRISAFGADIKAQSGSTIRLLTSGTAPNRMFTVQWHNYKRLGGLSESLNFQIVLSETYNGIGIRFGQCTIGNEPYYNHPQIGIRGSDFYDYANRSTTTNWLATTPGLTNAATCLCTPSVVPPSNLLIGYNYPIDWGWDMAAIRITTNNLTPSVGSPSVFGVNIKNMGSMTQTDYTVKLMSGDMELASLPGPAITYQQVSLVTFNYVFTSPGPVSIYAKVVPSADNIPENNSTPVLDLNVQPVDTNWVTIGLGDLRESSPIEVSEHNSLYETIYYTSEMNVTGQIAGMTLYYRFNDSSTVSTPLKIWLGTTTMNDLSNNWMPSTMMTNVFDGAVTLPVNQNSVTINFLTPFNYSMNNLVVLLNRPWASSFYSTGDYWFVQYGDVIRGRGVYSMTTTFDPANPPTTGVNLSNMYPKVTFIINPNPVSIYGTVVGSNNPSLGLSNSTVHVSSPIEYTTQTNVQGQFVISGVIPNRLYSMTISHVDYEDYSTNTFVGYQDTYLAGIVLDEIYYPPSNAVAVVTENSPFIHWHGTMSTHLGYKVWRLRPGEESNEENWILLTPAVIADTSFTDTSWYLIPNGLYKWAVKGVNPNNTVTSSAFTNSLHNYSHVGFLSGTVMSSDMQPIHGARISILTFEGYTNELGSYSFMVPSDTLDIICSAAGYQFETVNQLPIQEDQNNIHNFVLGPVSNYNDGFEQYEDFAIDFPPWVNVDLDGDFTAFFSHSYPNATLPIAYMVFNPSATNPPVSNLISPHSGNKIAVCFCSNNGVNNDWLVSPLLGTVGESASIHFWTRSLDAEFPDRLRVLVSGGSTDPADFVLIAGDPYFIPPTAWTYNIMAVPQQFYGKVVRFAFNCVSNWGNLAAIDDFEFIPGTAVDNDDNTAPPAVTALYGNYPNPFHNETHISYAISKLEQVKLQIFNIRGQRVRTLVSGKLSAGQHSLVWDGTDDTRNMCASGVYILKFEAGAVTKTKKMIRIK